MYILTSSAYLLNNNKNKLKSGDAFWEMLFHSDLQKFHDKNTDNCISLAVFDFPTILFPYIHMWLFLNALSVQF